MALVGLALSAAYDAAVALRWIPIGDVPGRGAPGEDAFAIAGVAALFAGIVVSLAGIRSPTSIPATIRRLLPVAAAAFVIATGLGFDPYYAPEYVRYPDNSGVPTTSWLGVIAEAAMCAMALDFIHARTGMVATAVFLLLCLGTFVLTGSGQ